jgi:hypothetical protein
MNSIYGFNANARRKWEKWRVGFGAAGSRTGLSQEPGTVSSSQSYNASMGYSTILAMSGGYFRSSGQALQTGAGLVTVPIPTPVLPSSLVDLYGGQGFSVTAASTIKRLILSSTYSKSDSNTTYSGATSSNNTSEFNAFAQSQFRKLYFNSGYSRLEQGFSASGTAPEVISTFYVGISRWFNVF